MPAVSEKQRRLMGIALAIKRGKTPKSYSPSAAKVAETMTVDQLREYTSAIKPKRKGKRG